MVKMVEISDPKIIRLDIDVEKEKITVMWAKSIVNTTVKVESGTFVFWKTLPAIEPLPSSWYKINSDKISHVTEIIQMVENFILANVE